MEGALTEEGMRMRNEALKGMEGLDRTNSRGDCLT